jgi:hypothetical protein
MNFDEAQAINTPSPVEHGVRFARYRMLEELPGLIFGLMTVAYIVTSLARLVL